MPHADSERADVQNRLETLKDKLVQNYVQEQQKLYPELLPEVTHKQPWCFLMLKSLHTTMAVSSLLVLLVSDSHQAVLLHPPWQRFSHPAASTEVH